MSPMYQLNKLWRIVATGICFAFFSFFGLLVSTTLFPLIHLLPGGKRQNSKRVRHIVHKIFRIFVGMMSFFGLIKVTIHNLAELQQAKGCLVIANHPTLIDVVILIAEIPNANGVIKADLFRHPFLKRVVSYAGFISNNNGEEMLKESARSLADGDAIIIFPEGSRSVPSEPLVFLRGTANIAVRTESPMLSVFIRCDPITLTKGLPWYVVPERRANIDIWVKEWLNPAQFCGDLGDKTAAARRLTQGLQNYYNEGLKLYE